MRAVENGMVASQWFPLPLGKDKFSLLYDSRTSEGLESSPRVTTPVRRYAVPHKGKADYLTYPKLHAWCPDSPKISFYPLKTS